jgi:phytoene dehydrogenase-like protein
MGATENIGFEPLDHRISIPEAQVNMVLPGASGFEGCLESFAAAFPQEKDKLHRYFSIEKEVWDSTPFNSLLNTPSDGFDFNDYDFKTVAQVIGEIGLSPAAAAAVNSFAMCHGSLTGETSMSFHSRVSYLMHTGLSRQIDGGDPIIAGFKKTAAEYGIRCLCSTSVAEIRAVGGDCREVVLTSGEVLNTAEIFFTIHPVSAMQMMPEECVTTSIRRRLKRMNETCSFITAYFNVDDVPDFVPQLADRFTGTDIDQLLAAPEPSTYGTGLMLHR